MKSEPVTVNKSTIEKHIYDKNQLLLKYTIHYPQFSDENNDRGLMQINYQIRSIAAALIRRYNNEMAEMACEQYRDSLNNNYPFNNFEAVLDYKIHYNQNHLISLYFDQYEYTGGAHGTTLRTSYTWDTITGRILDLSLYFGKYAAYKNFIVMFICDQIAEEISHGENIYFEDYCNLADQNFNPRNYYLSPEGIVIYYQHYDIAPYASGIREFIIPYNKIR